MAFDASKFARISSHGNNDIPHMWGYRTADDAKATVDNNDYFLEKTLELTVGDLIWCDCSDGFQFLAVATNTGTAVTTAVIDTD